MKTFGKPFEKYLQELWFFFWIVVCLEVSYNKGIENGNWMIYLQSLVVFVKEENWFVLFLVRGK